MKRKWSEKKCVDHNGLAAMYFIPFLAAVEMAIFSIKLVILISLESRYGIFRFNGFLFWYFTIVVICLMLSLYTVG